MVCKNGHNWGPLLYSPEYERGNFCFSNPNKTDNWVRFCIDCGYANKVGIDKYGKGFVEDLPKLSYLEINSALESWESYHKKSIRSYRISDFMYDMYERHYKIKGKYPAAEEFPLEDESDVKFPRVTMFGLYDFSGPYLYIDKDHISRELNSYLIEYVLTVYHNCQKERQPDAAVFTLQSLLDHVKDLYSEKEIEYNKNSDLWEVSR